MPWTTASQPAGVPVVEPTGADEVPVMSNGVPAVFDLNALLNWLVAHPELVSDTELGSAVNALAQQVSADYELKGVAQTLVTTHENLPIHKGGIVQVVYNSSAAQWRIRGTTSQHSAYTGPKQWIWGAGEPDPTTLMAENDTVLGNG